MYMSSSEPEPEPRPEGMTPAPTVTHCMVRRIDITWSPARRRAAGGETGFAAVTEGGPEWDRAEGTGSEIVGGGGTALECDADEAVAHFTDEVVRG